MSQRSRLPPQRSDVDERPSTDAEQPSKPDLMCPTCGTFLVNVGNLNRHRRDLHRWVNPDNKKTRKVQLTHLVLSEGNASGPPSNTSEPAGWMADSDLPIIPPFPPLEDLVDTHLNPPTAKPLRTITRTSRPVTSTMPPRTQPPLTDSTLLSASSDSLATPSPPCVVRTLGHTLGGNISSRENHSFATSFSSPVDDRNHSSDAMDSGGITDHGDFSIFAFGTTHSSVPSHRSTEFDVVKGSSKKVIRVSGPCRALQASTSYPQQAYHTPLFSAQSGDHLAGLSEQAPYERSAHSALDLQLFPAVDSHRHPDFGEHLRARYASFDEITHYYLNDPAIHVPNFFGTFNPCCLESDMSTLYAFT
ncbi:hypothetical protein K525DRAFT_269807 [Schizophyllum commune Loenen D]|nr:hypothetical protein K525DRAFT_269807 [Schizophyllum commune Loenen D]